MKKFWEPTFLAFDLNIKGADLLFKPLPWQEEFIKIVASKIKIYNS
jgi:hypothetical protein